MGATDFLAYDVERALSKLLEKELEAAGSTELLKQDLASSYDFNLETLFNEIDDCNLKFVDAFAIKRYLVKCSIFATEPLLVAVIRRLDLDADARLSRREFFDGVLPMENYTQGSLATFKQASSRRQPASYCRAATRPQSAKPSPLSNTLHGTAVRERRFMQ